MTLLDGLASWVCAAGVVIFFAVIDARGRRRRRSGGDAGCGKGDREGSP